METGEVASPKKRQRTKKKDISIMTLLAFEATDGARKLLIKYGVEDASSYEDLEWKLTQLYFSGVDKAKLEEEMAAIHPHKNWLFKVTKPKDIPATNEKEVIPKTSSMNAEEAHASIRSVVDEKQSGCCGCKSCAGSSSLDGEPQSRSFKIQDAPIGIMGIIIVAGLTFYFLSRTIGKEA
jgi:DNA polymerase III delta prime subunit